MTRLSVNVNKIATLRNARGGNVPDLIQVTKDIQQFGAEGITIHPRPDERHIRYQDAYDLLDVVHTEYNIEGNPVEKFIKLVLDIKPTQVTLVPDAVDVLTSNAGWDTVNHQGFLKEVINEFKSQGIRTSIFVDPDIAMIEGAKATGTDCIELYTEGYANRYPIAPEQAVKPYVDAAFKANELGLSVNAGHDLSLQNTKFFKDNVPYLDEVSIGHALVSEALYYGFESVIKKYLELLHQ